MSSQQFVKHDDAANDKLAIKSDGRHWQPGTNCSSCRNRISGGVDFRLSSLKADAEECEVCGAIFLGISSYAKEHNLKVELSIRRHIIFRRKDQGRPVEFGTDTIGGIWQDMRIYSLEGGYVCGSVFGQARDVVDSSSSRTTLLLITNWLRTCLRDHDLCRTNIQMVKPARVIEIVSQAQNITTKLVEFHASHEPYLVLSYCWGKLPFLKTTHETLKENQYGIVWSRLPKTFQDAVTLTYKLGFRFVWIDALCIIQDDTADWERESAKMGDVYEGAVLTICAAKGDDTSSGLFHERYVQDPEESSRPAEKRSTKFPFVHNDAAITNLCISMAFNHDSLKRVDDTNLADVFSRGWILQEDVLSSRKLWFLRDEVVWECAELGDCECHGAYHGGTLNTRGSFLVAKNWLNSTGFGTSEQRVGSAMGLGHVAIERVNLTKMWTDLMKMYSSRKLSYTSDKLPAISGLAKRFGRAQAGEYLAGLWEAGLPHDLLWTPRETFPGTVHLRSSTHQLPTWTWSSYEGDVLFSAHFTDYLYYDGLFYIEAEILQAHCIPAGSDTTGEVSSGSITLRAPLVPLEVEHSENAETGFPVGLRVDGKGPRDGYKTAIYIPEDSDSNGTGANAKLLIQSLRSDPGNRVGKAIPDRLFMLIIYTSFAEKGMDTSLFYRMMKSTSRFWALCLKQPETNKSEFERYGTFGSGGGAALSEIFCRLLADRAKKTTVVIV